MRRNHFHPRGPDKERRCQPNKTNHEMAEPSHSSMSFSPADYSMLETEPERCIHNVTRTLASSRSTNTDPLQDGQHSGNDTWKSNSTNTNTNLEHSCTRSRSRSNHVNQATENLGLCNDNVDSQNQKIVNSVLKLPEDVLYIILNFLNQSDLCRLSLVCKSFNHICSKDFVWLRHVKTTIFHNGLSLRKPCPFKELCRLALNWERGRFKFSFKAKHKIKLIPCLQKDENVVWFSSGNVIRYFHRDQKRGWRENIKRSLQGLPHDATRFAVKHNMLAAGCRDGSVHLWSTSNSSHVVNQRAKRSDTLCVDLTEQAVVSGSEDGICTVSRINWSLSENNGIDLPARQFNAEEKVWALKVSPCESFFVAGLAGHLIKSPLVMWDIESGHSLGRLGLDYRRGAGILDIHFLSQHEVLTCGYDTILRLWDLRTHKCVANWDEPYDYTLYSVTSDGGNAISVGTSRHGLVRLWDKRSTEHVQCFYSNQCHSPVYSLAMDHSNLFLALDMGFSTMDFSVR